MSRIGRAPVPVPRGVQVAIGSGEVLVRGPKGELRIPVHSRIEVRQEGEELQVARQSDHRFDRSQHGLVRSLLANAVTGVTQGFTRTLEIRGVGYRCAMNGRRLELSLGFSHPVAVDPPDGVTIEAPEPTRITVSGIDKQLVGQVAADIRGVRPPDSYHGKGVRYLGEHVRLKPGKSAAR